MIQYLVTKYGKKWTQIAEIMKTRTHRQIRERYLNYLDPKIQKEEWTCEEEDQRLSFLSKNPKVSWRALSQHFPGRTDVYLKNKAAVFSFKNKISQLTRLNSSPNAALLSSESNKNLSTENAIEKISEDKFLEENFYSFTWIFNDDFQQKKNLEKN
jgi:hypothetical protein